MNKTVTQKYPWLPYVSAILIFLVVSMIYFAPQFRGEVLDMHDVNQYVASSGDIERHVEEYGEDPQWTGNSFGGMPSYMINFKVHSLLIRKLSKLPVRLMGEPAILIFTAMLFFWFMLLLIGINPWVGIIPSLAYGLSTYTILIIAAGHINKVWAMAYIPLLIGAIWYAYRSKDWKGLLFGGSLAALAASLEISANHPQITWYFLLVIVALAVNEFILAYKAKTLGRFGKATGVLAIAAVMAVASNAGTLYYTAQHTGDTTRGGTELSGGQLTKAEQRGLDLEYATAWSYGRTESFNLLIPNLKGGASDRGFSDDGPVAQSLRPYGQSAIATQLPAYWGDQPMTAGPTYIGAVMLFLAVLALFVLPGRKKWWLFIVSVLALLLSWGSNMMWFTELCFKILPGYNKFRAVSTALVIIQWSVPVLAALILSQIWKAKPSKAKIFKGVKWALGITGGIALFFALFGGMLFNFSSAYDTGLPNEVVAAMRRERLMMLRSDAWRSFIFVALSAGVVTLFAADKIKRGVLVSLMAVLVCADLIPVDMRYLSWNDFVPKRKTELRPTEADATIMQDKEPGYRVADLTTNPFSDARASYFHRSIGGYHGAKLQRYQDLIDNHLSQMNMEVYDMLNTKYFIVSDRSTGIPQVQLNDGANGPAWFVETVLMVHSPDEELAALNDIDTKLEAVVDIEKFGDMPVGMETAGDPDAYIALVDYKTNHLTYEYSSAVPQIAVFSEIYYDKGWTAYIDGEEASYFRADYVLRAMTLPAGEHTIEFRFAAPNFASVSAVTFIFSLLILLAFAGSAALLVIDRRKKKQLKV